MNTAICTWQHRTADGVVIGEIQRFVSEHDGKKKDIPCYTPSDTGYSPGIPAEKKENGYLPFGLDSIQDARRAVLFVEGQKSQSALASLGFQCVTSILGSGSAHLTNWKPLEGIKTGYLLPDNDECGDTYMKSVHKMVSQFSPAPEMKIARLPGLPEKGDVCDWLKQQPELADWDECAALTHHPARNFLRERLQELIRSHLEPIPASWTEVKIEEQEWETPILFEEETGPDISASFLPSPLAEFASALADTTETPETLSVMTVLGIMSVCSAKRFKVTPKEGWEEPVNIYTCCALPPANNKSKVINTCTAPLVAWEIEQRILLEPEIKRQYSERKSQEKIIESMRAKAAKTQDPLDQRDLLNQINEKESNLPEPKPLPKLFINDVTPETLGSQVYEQGERLAIISDEGGILEAMGGLYSNGVANVDILLKGIDGGHVRTRRNARTIDLNPYLTMALALQPAVIQNMSEKKAFRGNGTMERFLFTRPASKLGFRTHDKPSPPSHVVAAYEQKIRNLLTIAPLIENGQEKARLLTLAPDAWEEWRAFQNKIETELRPGEKLSPILGFGGKICGYALRIAGLLHVAEYELTSSVISKETIEHALEIATLLIEHALVVNNLISSDPTIHDAKEVYHWIMREKKPSFTQTEVTRAMKNRNCGRSERLGKAVQVLLDRNIVRAQKMPTPTKPTIVYAVNPQLLKG